MRPAETAISALLAGGGLGVAGVAARCAAAAVLERRDVRSGRSWPADPTVGLPTCEHGHLVIGRATLLDIWRHHHGGLRCEWGHPAEPEAPAAERVPVPAVEPGDTTDRTPVGAAA